MNCFHCYKHIKTEESHTVEISVLHRAAFPTKVSSIHFHSDCFQSVAGKKFTSALEKEYQKFLEENNKIRKTINNAVPSP